ncbi:N-methyl-L-tryptophan oxidase [Deinococcus fonticola]|uniref:N-methyl-L-tryptophan oxidase n=1 Tax=Deinococcus fonticola TaxID=2528713 RepID=UPI001074A24D|nr:N-methyl-L-tryptophan oxidase [Deinococcus fonticola]
MGQHFPFMVVGAGGAGAAAAYHLARRGLKPLLIEQFRVGHDRGSSFGHSRIFRLAYDEPEYASLAQEALPAWRALEQEVNMPLYTRTGGLDLGPSGTPTLTQTLAALERIGAVAESLTRAELRRRFPQWHVPDDWAAVYAPEAGIVNPTQTVELLCALTNAHGGQVLENTRVDGIDLGKQLGVHTDAGSFTCDRLVVTAGAWTAKLFPELQEWLTPTLAATTFYRPLEPQAFTPQEFPIFITHDEFQAYGFPSFGLPGVKIGVDVSRPVVDADLRPFDVPGDAAQASDEFMRRYLPDAAGSVMHRQTCLITRAPTTDFLMAAHPQCEQIIVASPCSGHGFKFVPLLGEILAAKALGEAHRWDLPRFGFPARFS